MLTVDDNGSRRLLFPNGVSVVSEWDKAKEILRGTPLDTKCIKGYETDRYLELYRQDLSVDIDSIESPSYDDHEHTEEELERLISIIETSDRWSDENVDRVVQELEFFTISKNIRFLLKVYDLVHSLKRDTVVGVGRGSSCASYVMYLMHIHDINSMLYDIDFKELTKIDEDEYNA